jgi:hypothetical protein
MNETMFKEHQRNTNRWSKAVHRMLCEYVVQLHREGKVELRSKLDDITFAFGDKIICIKVIGKWTSPQETISETIAKTRLGTYTLIISPLPSFTDIICSETLPQWVVVIYRMMGNQMFVVDPSIDLKVERALFAHFGPQSEEIPGDNNSKIYYDPRKIDLLCDFKPSHYSYGDYRLLTYTMPRGA